MKACGRRLAGSRAGHGGEVHSVAGIFRRAKSGRKRRRRAGNAPPESRRRAGRVSAARLLGHHRAPPAHQRRDCRVTAWSGAGTTSAKGSARLCAWSASALAHVRSKGVSASRLRSRCALAGDMPTARAACVTLPVASRLVRKRRCLSGVQRTGSVGSGAEGAGGLGESGCSIHEDRSEEILFWKGNRIWGDGGVSTYPRSAAMLLQG